MPSVGLHPRRVARRNAALFVALVTLSASRSPYVVLSGRFWAEEGRFFPAIDEASGLAGLLFVQSEAGYFTFLTNLVVLVATWFPLEIAPLITAWSSIAVVAAIGVVLHHHLAGHPAAVTDPYLRAAALIAPFVLVAGPASYPETWANSINLLHYLPILSFILVAAYPVSEGHTGRSRLAAPLILGISSPYSAVVGLLEWKAPGGIARGPQRVAAIGATAGFLVQVGVFVERLSRDSIIDERSLSLTPFRVAENIAYALSSTTVGQEEVLGFIASIESWVSAPVLAYVATTALSTVVFAMLLSGSDPMLRLLVAASFGGVILLVTVAAFQGVGRGRYTVASAGILVVATFLALFGATGAERSVPRRTRVAGAVLIGMFLFVTVADHWTMEREAFLVCDGCPDWRSEVARARQDPSGRTEIGIWPYPEWTMEIGPLR